MRNASAGRKGRPASSAGFSQPRTTQRGKNARRRKKEFDDYVERHSKTRETAEEEERQTHKRSRGRSMDM